MQRKLTPEQRERRNQRNRAYKARKKAERAVYPPITQVSEEVEFINDFIKSTRINSNVRKVSRELRTRGLNVPPNLREVLFFLRGGTSRSARKSTTQKG